MNPLNDPMAAAFVPLVLLMLFGWGMAYALGRQGDHSWWVNMLQTVRLVPNEPEPETPIHTKTNVLYLGADRGLNAPLEREPVDYTPVIKRSRAVFRGIGLTALVLTCVLGFLYYKRADPYFIWGPKPKALAPGQPGELPPPIPGAGGAGTGPFAQPAGGSRGSPFGTRAPGPTGAPGLPGR
jgi:hypothetical protein